VCSISRAVAAACVCIGALTHASPARSDSQPARGAAIEWRWRTFQPWEYVATAAALGGGFYLRFIAPPRDANWTGGILFDDWVRDRVAIQDVPVRNVATRATDVMFYGAMTYRLVDSVFVPGFGWGRWDTAFQMAMVDLEAFGFVAITLWGTQAVLARQRPYVSRCGEPGIRAAESCRPDEPETNRSFFAGHPAVGLTAAGLTCVHHKHLPLYGGSDGDMIACGVMLGLAAVNGIGRVVTEKHYVSDLMVGFGVGTFAGWALPELLHYAHPQAPIDEPPAARAWRSTRPRVLVLPTWSDDRPGLTVIGLL
jgi:membrane-associated phospholipid phosphatase